MKYPSEVPSEVCGVSEGCISEVMYACECEAPLVFMCLSCVHDHLQKPKNHHFIRLEDARKILKDTNFYLAHAKFNLKQRKIRKSFTLYLKRLQGPGS